MGDAAVERKGPAFARRDLRELRHGRRERRKEILSPDACFATSVGCCRDTILSAAFHKYGDAPRAARRPHRKARGGNERGPHRAFCARWGAIPGVFDRRATSRGGMHRRPNATVIVKWAT